MKSIPLPAKIPTIKEEWELYKASYKQGMLPEQENQIKMAFYGGHLSMFHLAMSITDLDDTDAENQLLRFSQELNSFYEEIKKK